MKSNQEATGSPLASSTSLVSPGPSPDDSVSARIVSFYLPQFHPIPENDRWWGKGFTEWTNSSRALPLFEGHYQPHIPADLGFCDLRLPETRIAQADLAREYGIEAFCYWHYYFNGKLLLERPFQEVLASGEPGFPFCLAWANENWTRRWDGHEHEILQAQTYGGEEDDERHFALLLEAFRDERYLKVDGKPVFLLYRPGNLPDPSRTIALWRRLAAESDLPGLYLVAIKTSFEAAGSKDWTEAGFDAELLFQPHFPFLTQLGYRRVIDHQDPAYVALNKTIRNPGLGVFYRDAWPLLAHASMVGGTRHACVVPSWDNTARRGINATVLHESTPREFEKWLSFEVKRAQRLPHQERLVFVNAWNEWAEGNHVEPDLRHGRAYLEAIKSALASPVSEHEFDDVLSLIAQKLDLIDEPAQASRYRLHASAKRGPSSSFKASIVIPIWNRADFTQKCLEALAGSIPEDFKYEVIIVDNGSTDGTADLLDRLGGDVQVIRNQANLGFAKACNQGAQAARGEWIVFLNNDTEPREGWLEEMLKLAEAQPRVGVVGAKLLYPDGTVQHAGVVFTGRAEGKFIQAGEHFDKDVFIDHLPYHLYRKMPADAPYVNKVRDFQVVTGACLAVRRDLFDASGGFDEAYRNGFEDVDLCLKVLQQGHRVVYCPTAVVVHHESKSQGRHDHDLPNARLFHERWQHFIVPDDDRFYQEDGFVSEQPQERMTVYRWNEHLARADSLFEAGQLEAALAEYEEFLESSPQHGEARTKTAVIRERLSAVAI